MRILPGFILLSMAVHVGNPALAQNYNYRSGGNRVIQQSDIGLEHPSSSYITGGTLSKSAQGSMQGGPENNPGLPRVNHGAFVGTPGDNLYSNQPIRASDAYVENRRLLQIKRRRAQAYSQPKPNVNYYVPGQNASAAEYSGAEGGVSVDYQGGVASYGRSSAPSVEPPRSESRHY